MPLGRTQTQIIDKLEEMGKLTAENKTVLLARPDEPTGDQLDQILQADHRITMFQLLLAKCRALGLAPYNVARVTACIRQRLRKSISNSARRT